MNMYFYICRQFFFGWTEEFHFCREKMWLRTNWMQQRKAGAVRPFFVILNPSLHVTSEISTSFFTSIELVSKSFSAKNDFCFSDKEAKLDVIVHNHRNSKAIWNEARSRSIKVGCKFELITSLPPPYVECSPRSRSNLHLAREWQNIAMLESREGGKRQKRGGTGSKGRRAEKREEVKTI